MNREELLKQERSNQLKEEQLLEEYRHFEQLLEDFEALSKESHLFLTELADRFRSSQGVFRFENYLNEHTHLTQSSHKILRDLDDKLIQSRRRLHEQREQDRKEINQLGEEASK